MTIAGPNINMPSVTSPISEGNTVARAWATYLAALGNHARNASRSGPTASRPTKAMPDRYIGMPYFDTTLGVAIWLSSINPDVWVRWDGTPV